eukprot:scaffold25998_cov122-Cylindrotheca_fusiformis.AAC.4
MSTSTPNRAMAPVETPPSSETALPKKDRKKLKKLRNRVFKVQNEGERSGLLTAQEFAEFELLEPNNISPVGPAIRKRLRKDNIKVEGAHHRDLLAWLMKQVLYPTQSNGGKSKKRPRRSQREASIQTASIPSWASVHNPGMLKSITVLDIQVSDDLSFYTNAFESFLDSDPKLHHIKVATKWFQGPAPRSVSDSMLYFADKRSKKGESDSCPASREELVGKLEDLVLNACEWEKEGYPTPTSKLGGILGSADRAAAIVQASDNIDLSAISLDDAKALVVKLGMRVKDQDDADTTPYVASISTKPLGEHRPRVFGMDCEMVRSSVGPELARITLVEFEDFQEDAMSSTTVMDSLVKPDRTVIDYLTRHSGITPSLLEPVSIGLSQVQVALLRYLRPSDILIGHSLENDLRAAHFIHPNVIDTALIFRPSNKRTKFSLRHLSAFLLQRKIQGGSHCSEEDAKAALELAIRRAWLGDSFYVPSGDERLSIFEGLQDARIMCSGPATWLQSHITNFSNGIHALAYSNVDESKKAILAWQKSPRKTHLVCSQLVLNKVSVSTGDDTNSLDALLVRKIHARKGIYFIHQSQGELLTNVLHALLQIEVTKSIPSTSLILVAFQRDYPLAKQLHKQKKAAQDLRSAAGWSMDQDEALNRVIENCRSGVVFWIGSSNDGGKD